MNKGGYPMKRSMKKLFGAVLGTALTLTAAMSVFAAEKEMVNVTVNEADGGAISVYYNDGDGHIVYLPIGETSKIPSGKHLTVETEGMEYITLEDTRITTYAEYLEINDEIICSSEIDQIYAYEDMEISVVFRGEEVSLRDKKNVFQFFDVQNEQTYGTTYGVINPELWEEKRILIYNPDSELAKELVLNGRFDISEIEYTDENGKKVEEYPKIWFEIDEEGFFKVHSSSDTLENGVYSMTCYYEYWGSDEVLDENYSNIEFELNFQVGVCVEVELPYAIYENNLSLGTWDVKEGKSHWIYLDSIDGITYGDIYREYLKRYDEEYEKAELDDLYEYEKEYCKLFDMDIIGLGTFNSEDGSITSCENQLVKADISSSNLHVKKYLILEDYDLPKLNNLSEDDIVIQVDSLQEGWNEIAGDWYYRKGDRLMRNRPMQCGKQHGESESNKCRESVYFGHNGKLLVNTVKGTSASPNKINTTWYLYDENGHRTKYTGTIDKNGIVWKIEDGKLAEEIEEVEVPETAVDIAKLACTIRDYRWRMSDDSLKMAADALTSGLNEIEPSQIQRCMVGTIGYAYEYAYGNLVKRDGNCAVSSGMAGAGLFSEEVNEDTKVQYVTEWLSTDSNATFSLKLYVNGEEREKLASKIRVRIFLPEEMIASYSNAMIDDEAVEAFKVVSGEDEDGKYATLYFYTTRLGEFELIPGTDAGNTNKPGTGDDNTNTPGNGDGNTSTPGTDDGNTNTPNNGGSNSGSSSGSGSGSGSSSGSGSGSGSGSSKKTTTTTNVPAAEKGTWVKNENGWTITLSDGTTPKSRWARLTWGESSQWYYFDENGQMTTGWVLSNGKWYYLHPESDGTQGYMHTGWNQINGQWFYMNPVEGDTTGAVLTGWQLIDGKWYYFSEVKDSTEGMMLSNTTTPDGYQVGADGAWIQ